MRQMQNLRRCSAETDQRMSDAVMTIFVRDPNVLAQLASDYADVGCSSVFNTAKQSITVTRA